MSSLLAELQAKQKARASVVLPGPPPVPGGAGGGAATSSAPSSGAPSPSTTPAPRAGPPPPPLPASRGSTIMTGPPLAAAAASPISPPMPPPVHTSPPPPPIPSGHRGSIVPPPLPPGVVARPPPPPPSINTSGGPPPPPPHPSANSVAAALSPAHSPRPPPPVGARPPPPPLSHPAITVPTSSGEYSDAGTPSAPDTPVGGVHHRSTGSFSSMAPQPFSPSPNPLSPGVHHPNLLPAFPTHALGGPPAGAQKASHTLFKRPISEASRQVYLNDGAEYVDHGVDSPAREFRLASTAAASGISSIKLASTVRVLTESQESRFVDDFVPSIPSGADALVASSLTAFSRPIKAFVRSRIKYQRVAHTEAATSDTTGKLVEFEVDEEASRDGPSGGGPAAGNTVSGGSAAKAKTNLTDLFQQPTTPPTGGAPGVPGLERQSTESAAAAAREAEEARAEEVAALCNLSLLAIAPDAVDAAVKRDDALFAAREESLFLRAHPQYEYREAAHKVEYTVCKRLPPSSATAMWSRDPGHQFLLSVAQLRLGIGNVEPFFGTLALYDLKAGVRLSEDFHFDLNDNSLLTGQLEVNKSCADPITLCAHALFSVRDRHADVVLVVKLERILQGDPAEMEHYHRLKLRPSTEMAALVKKTRNNLIYLSDYRQPFGWGMLSLFEETGELRNFVSGGGVGGAPHERGPNFVRFERIFQQVDSLKDDLFVQLAREARESPSKAGGKQYPGTWLDVKIEEMEPNELPANRVDVSCIALKNTETCVNVPEVAEYNVAADMPLPTGQGSPVGTPPFRPSIVVPPTPMASGPQTPSMSGVPPTPLSAASTPQHSASFSISLTGSGPSPGRTSDPASAAAAAAGGPLAPLHTTPFSNNPIPSPPIIREVEELSDYAPPAQSTGMVPTPHTSFVNLLYLYPEFIKFEKFRNIACRIQFRNSDASVILEGLPVIRGKSSGSNLAFSSLTQVNYHRKQVTPQEEVKVMLPLSLGPSTHIFFTFYKVSCKTKPGSREVIGHAVLPLMNKGRMLVDDVYHLPIAAKLPKNYLGPYADARETDELHFRHGGLKCFSVRIRLASSIFSQDEHIYSFLHTFPTSKELVAAGPHHGKELLNKAIEHMHRINPWYTIKFLPALMDYLFELIQNRGTASLQPGSANQIQASYFGFLGLTYLIFRISEYYVNESGQSGNRCAILVAYITHRLENLVEPVVVPLGAAPTPNAMGVEAGGEAAAASSGGVTYAPLYAIFTKLWLVGLNPAATSDNAALFTLPSATSAASSSILASAAAAAAAAAAGGAPAPTSPAQGPGATSPGASSSRDSHQALHERLLISYAWFYFEVIYKSLVLERDRQMKTLGHYADDDYLRDFLTHFESLIGVIVSILYKHRTVGLTSVKHLIHSLALFFNDLFSVLEKERVIKFVTTFLHAFRLNMNYADPVLVEIKFTFYSILLDFEWFVDVCEVAPLTPEPSAEEVTASTAAAAGDQADDDDDPTELLTRIRKRYPLVALFLADYVRNLARSRETMIRDKIITSLRAFLTKIDYDARWQSNKADIAVMFLPLLPAHLDELDILKTAAERERERERDQEADGVVTAQISSHKAHPLSSAAGVPGAASSPLSPLSGTTGAGVGVGAASGGVGSEESKLRRNILVCVLWVVKNVPLPLLRAWWRRDLLAQSAATAAASAASRESSVSDRETGHVEGPLVDFLFLLDACLHAFPYSGVRKRCDGGDLEEMILSPETVASLQGDVGGHAGVADIKSDIEALMSNIHKTRTLGAGGGTLRAQRMGANAERNATLGGAAAGTGKSTLRQLRAQLSTKNATIGPGGLNMAMLASGAGAGGESISGVSGGAGGGGGGTIGRGSTINGLPGGGTLSGSSSNLLAAAAAMSTSGGTGTYRGSRSHNATLNSASAPREYVLRIVQWEGLLARAVSRIVITSLHAVLEDLHQFIDVEKRWTRDADLIDTNCLETFHGVLRVFTSFVASHQATSTLLALFPTMLLFVQRYGRFFHRTNALKRAIGAFASVSFRVCAFASREVRTHAVALMYSLLTNNYELDHNLFHLQMQLTISLSKLTENLSVAHEKHLQNSISALMRMAAQAIASETNEVPKPSPDFKTRLDTLLGRLSTILSDSMEITRQTKLGSDADSATSESLLVQIADAFSHIPEIKIEWLSRLAHHHQHQEQYAEAAQCYIQMATLVTSTGSATDGGVYSMVDSKTPVELDKLVAQYREHACRMLDKAELYEQCSDVYQQLQPIYHKYRDYKSLSASHHHLHLVFEKLMDANRKQSRMLGTYYRVGFYGLKFGERLHGQEWIYKLPKITRLSEVAARMKTLYSNQLGCPVRVLPDSSPVDVSKLENIAEECLLQITFVSPSFLAEDGEGPNEFEKSIDMVARPRTTWIEQNCALQAFKFSTPFTSGGKAFGSVTEQHKRNTILYVRAEFPYILTAQAVVRRVETILSPIASATEDVILRTNSLLELVQSETLNAKALTGLLAGSVATQVHGGSKEICQAFLSADETNAETPTNADGTPAAASPWSAEDQSRLRDAMRAFLDACVLGLAANKKLAASDAEKEFQANLEQQFQELTAVIHPLIRPQRNIKKNKAKKGVRFG